ncbi:MAG: VOC family protein [Acidimicrobiia bacterium]|nr:VOC family protein [Acidimicrobiia bacterium]
MAFYPYLNFGGNCREAFARYHEIVGGDLQMMGFSDVPEGEDVPPGMDGMVANAALVMADGDMIMGSDDPGDTFTPAKGMYVNCTVDDVAEADRIFEALADGGSIEMAIDEVFWSPRFGICVDRFGTPWMVNTAPSDG